MRARWVVGPRSRARHVARHVGSSWYPICGGSSIPEDDARATTSRGGHVYDPAGVLATWVCPDCRRTLAALTAQLAQIVEEVS